MALLVGCPGAADRRAADEGTVLLSFSDARAKTIAPEVSLDIASYDISFSRSGCDTVTLEDLPGDTALTDPVYLKAGSWTVSASAHNDSGDRIGEGSADVHVIAGQTSTVTLDILSLSGNGEVTLSADVSEVDADCPAVVATLTSGSGDTVIVLGLAVEAGVGTCTASLPAGSYLLELALWDGDEELASYIDSLLVVAGLTTEGSFSFSVSSESGSVVVELVDGITRPIPIVLSGLPASLCAGRSATVTATPERAVDSYQWYLDGKAVSGATSSQIRLGPGLVEGDHILTIVVKAGAVYSSESAVFTVRPAAGARHTLIVKDDGSNWACGRNSVGALGIGSLDDDRHPDLEQVLF